MRSASSALLVAAAVTSHLLESACGGEAKRPPNDGDLTGQIPANSALQKYNSAAMEHVFAVPTSHQQVMAMDHPKMVGPEPLRPRHI